MSIKTTLTLVAVLALACFTVPTALAEDSATAEPLMLAAANTANHHDVNGKPVRTTKDAKSSYMNFNNKNKSFMDVARDITEESGIPTNEVLRLNGWADVVNDTVPQRIHFWLHPEIISKL